MCCPVSRLTPLEVVGAKTMEVLSCRPSPSLGPRFPLAFLPPRAHRFAKNNATTIGASIQRRFVVRMLMQLTTPISSLLLLRDGARMSSFMSLALGVSDAALLQLPSSPLHQFILCPTNYAIWYGRCAAHIWAGGSSACLPADRIFHDP